MPRSPEGVYSKPAGTNGGPPNTPISSAAYNLLMNDIAQDLNTPRPVTAGGTGSNTAVGGADNLHTASVPIPASATTDLSGATGIAVTITGSGSIRDFGAAHPGVLRVLTFESGATLIRDLDDPKIMLPGGAASYTAAAGDVLTFVSESMGVWRLVAASGGSKASFRAHKNGVNQPVSGTVKITFDTEEFDEGGYYDAPNSKWVPPAGKYRISATFAAKLATTGNYNLFIELRKNGISNARSAGSGYGTLTCTPSITADVQANGTDEFEIYYVFVDTAAEMNIRGMSYETWFCGEAI